MTEWIIAIASSITAVSVFIIWMQFKADHERSRRDRAVEIMSMWTARVSEMSPGARIVLKLIPELNQQQCERLWNNQPFSVDIKLEYLIEGIFQDYMKDSEIVKVNDQINLNQQQVSVMRLFAVTYLNLLEVVFAAWRHNIADRDIIRDEFASLVTPRKDYFPLDTLRIATGRYPSVAEFTTFMRREYNITKGKGKIA